MFSQHITRMASLALAFGLFFMGCSSPNPFIEDTKEHLGKENLRAALQAANAGVNSEPENPEMYYYRGLVYHQMAKNQATPSEKRDNYQNMANAFTRTKELYKEEGTRGRRTQEINYLLSSTWTAEHNAGAGILKEETGPSHNQLRQAVDYFRNAVAIQPDSVFSYKLLAEVFIQLDDPTQALEAMKKMTELSKDELQYESYERLAFLALNTGNYELAFEAYQNIPEDRYTDIHVAHGLINIYQRDEKPEKVVPIIQRLLAQNPDNTDYRIIFANQLHKLSISKYELWLDKYRSNPELDFSSHGDINEARQYESASITEYELLVQDFPQQIHLAGNLGIVLQNNFFIKERIAAELEDLELATSLNEEAANQLTTAIIMLEDAAEQVDEPFIYWETLIQIFTHTGDQEKADKYITLMESAL